LISPFSSKIKSPQAGLFSQDVYKFIVYASTFKVYVFLKLEENEIQMSGGFQWINSLILNA